MFFLTRPLRSSDVAIDSMYSTYSTSAKVTVHSPSFHPALGYHSLHFFLLIEICMTSDEYVNIYDVYGVVDANIQTMSEALYKDST